MKLVLSIAIFLVICYFNSVEGKPILPNKLADKDRERQMQKSTTWKTKGATTTIEAETTEAADTTESAQESTTAEEEEASEVTTKAPKKDTDDGEKVTKKKSSSKGKKTTESDY